MMDIKAIILFAATIVVTTSLASAADSTSGNYAPQPDCSSLEPQACTPITLMDDSGTSVSYDEYEENCPYHICTAIQPVYPIASNSSSKMSMIGEQRYWDSNDISRGGGTYGKSSAAFSSTIKASSQIPGVTYDPLAPWFCSGLDINYTVRVEANTGYPPGKKEDMHAQCQYLQLLDMQSLGDCRHMRYTCKDCSDFYRNWLCAMAFPRCFSEKTVTTYPSSSSVPTKIFGILKPCRGICWGVVQRCQQYMNFNCPMTDTRDYGDYPNCNAFGLDQGTTPYAKSIYW